MVKSLLLIAGLIFSSGLKAQEWFPLGASWYYNQIELLVGESFAYFEVTGDTVIQGKTCKIISGRCNCTPSEIGGYLYQDGDRIYTINSETDTFRILYDFTLVAGDTLIVRGNPTFGGDGYYLIDSITTIQAGSQTLRVQHITHLTFELGWGNKIIERIGSNGCLYPQVSFCDPSTGGLRCYEDDEIGLVNFQTPPRPCNYVTGIEDPAIVPVINIYPNPATSNVHIQSEKPIENLILFNNLAVPVYQQSSIFNSDFELDVLAFPGGIYHFQIFLSDHQIEYRSLVIQK
jgi:hypothetical protein